MDHTPRWTLLPRQGRYSDHPACWAVLNLPDPVCRTAFSRHRGLDPARRRPALDGASGFTVAVLTGQEVGWLGADGQDEGKEVAQLHFVQNDWINLHVSALYLHVFIVWKIAKLVSNLMPMV